MPLITELQGESDHLRMKFFMYLLAIYISPLIPTWASTKDALEFPVCPGDHSLPQAGERHCHLRQERPHLTPGFSTYCVCDLCSS